MDPIKQLTNAIPEIEPLLGYVFSDKNLLIQAFTHRSLANEMRGSVEFHNERLEYLGDAVLDLIVGEHLYRTLPQIDEGELSSTRSHLVEGSACQRYLENLNVAQYLATGRGEQMNLSKGSVLADLFEAIIGAIYLDGGLDAARMFFFRSCNEDIADILESPTRNWKTELQEYAQRTARCQPSYQVISEEGPDHSKNFEIGVYVGGTEAGRGSGSSKKAAQQAAAQDAMEKINGED
jgi:ribonuclease-3